MYCVTIIFVGFLMFRYAYPTEWFSTKALLTCLPLGYSLSIIKTCRGEGREESGHMDSVQRHISSKWIFGVGKRDPHLLIHRYVFGGSFAVTIWNSSE